MATAHGSNAKLFVKEQVDAETPATGNFVQLPFLTFNLTGSQNLGSDDLLSAGIGRDGSDPYLETLTVGGDVTVPFDTVNIGYWLKMIFGAATVTGTTDKVHVFTSGKTALPDFSMEKAFPEVPSFDKYLGVKGGGMSFDLAPTGPANATISLMGLSETTATTSGAGTTTLETFQRFYKPSGYIKKDGAALGRVVGGSVNMTNNMSGVQTVRSDARMEEVDYGSFNASGDLRVRFSDNVLKTQAIAGTPCALEYGFQISASKAIKFEFPRVFLSRPGVQIGGPAGIELPVSWRGSYDPTIGCMVRVSLTNQKASY